jgi:hypothetical protein
MSQLLIHKFLAELDRIRATSGSKRETVIREAFKDLLKAWAKQHDLVFIPEFAFETPAKEKRYVDGALLYSLRVPFGYWERTTSTRFWIRTAVRESSKMMLSCG